MHQKRNRRPRMKKNPRRKKKKILKQRKRKKRLKPSLRIPLPAMIPKTTKTAWRSMMWRRKMARRMHLISEKVMVSGKQGMRLHLGVMTRCWMSVVVSGTVVHTDFQIFGVIWFAWLSASDIFWSPPILPSPQCLIKTKHFCISSQITVY